MSTELESKCRALLVELQLISADEDLDIMPLTGGVASDIACVRSSQTNYCVKFALPKLKVEADWFAPVHRNAAEYAWLQTASQAIPESAVQLYGHSKKHHGFAMEFLEGEHIYLWKSRLLAGKSAQYEVMQVGHLLGKIHQLSTDKNFDNNPFHNQQDFYALRLEPYLLYTADKHPTVSEILKKLAEVLHQSQSVLVHGDVSPKNILFRQQQAVILDAECATMGDASFDPAFCINHLILKAIHLPSVFDAYLKLAAGLWQHYKTSITWESPDLLEQRVCLLVAALMLARIDGKSPVEYLDEQQRQAVRQLSLSLLIEPPLSVNQLLNVIRTRHTVH